MQALEAAGRTEEAEAYLTRLLEPAPGNGEVNRELGRLAARKGLEQEAIDDYHGAINGAWADHPRQQRIASREELSSFLLDAATPPGRKMSCWRCAATVPDDDATDVLQTAGLFARWERGWRTSRISDRPQDRSAQSWRAHRAGTCAYQIGDYRAAEDYLSRTQREGNRNAAVDDMLEKDTIRCPDPDRDAKK